ANLSGRSRRGSRLSRSPILGFGFSDEQLRPRDIDVVVTPAHHRFHLSGLLETTGVADGRTGPNPPVPGAAVFGIHDCQRGYRSGSAGHRLVRSLSVMEAQAVGRIDHRYNRSTATRTACDTDRIRGEYLS